MILSRPKWWSRIFKPVCRCERNIEPPAGIVLTPAELREVIDTLYATRADLWQHIRAAEYNLSGTDPNFPGDRSVGAPPEHFKFIHRRGLDESYAQDKRASELIQRLSAKERKKIVPFSDESCAPPNNKLRPGSKGSYVAPPLAQKPPTA